MNFLTTNPSLSPRYYRQHNTRWILFRVINRLCSFRPFGLSRKVPAGVQVPIETGKITARYFDTDAMPFFEDVACCPEIDMILVNFAGFDIRGICITVTETGANDTVAEIYSSPVRIHIKKFSGEIGIY